MQERRRALITGVAGQDGVYLARHLRSLGYDVVGTVISRQRSQPVIDTYLSGVTILDLDVRDRFTFSSLLNDYRPQEIYNLASESSVARSWSHPRTFTEVNGVAVLDMLEVLRDFADGTGYRPRFCQAASSEMFGNSAPPFTVDTPQYPRSPYGSAKCFAFHSVVNYRESFGIYAANAILFNHESPLRPDTFVTRKITKAAAEIALGHRQELQLGNLDTWRDWGAVSDMVVAMHLMLQESEPRDFILATGRSRSLLEFVGLAMQAAGVDDWRDRVVTDPSLVRPADVFRTQGDISATTAALGWAPRHGLEEIANSMVVADLSRLETGVEHSISYL